MKLALLVANRGFFPSTVIQSAREEMKSAFAKAGMECLDMEVERTKYGAVETMQEGRIYAQFLKEHDGEYDGVVICLPNFGDENGIKEAIRDVRVPILLQAYPDEIGKMDFANRRDAFCGKMALCSVFKQMGLHYTTFTPFTIHPSDPRFHQQLLDFAGICRIVRTMKHARIGALGARTTAFKSVRYDEMALERHGIDVESYDMSALFAAVRKRNGTEAEVKRWQERLLETSDFRDVPKERFDLIGCLAAAMDQLIQENSLDALAIRCWNELQAEFSITPCAVMGLFNQALIPIACETDVSNVVPMLGLTLAGNRPSGCLDLNNNYGDEEDKCIVFHCGPLPMDLMVKPGVIEEHKMFVKTSGPNCSWGVNVTKVRPGDITYAGGRTEAGEIQFYVDQGRITDDPIEEAFFGTGGVLQAQSLQQKMHNIARAGFRHHALITPGHVANVMREAFVNYLGYREIPML